MRLSRTSWLILGAGVFIIAFVTLFMLYSQQNDDERQLEERLAEAQAQLHQLDAESEDWQNQLAQLESQLVQAASALDSSKARFNKTVDSIEYDQELFNIAHNCNLEIASLIVSEPTEKEMEDVTYTTISFEVTLTTTGTAPVAIDAYRAYIDTTVANMVDFIDIVTTNEYFTLAGVDLVAIVFSDPNELDRDQPSATINLIIYVYEGD